jgi:hypothetical protein
VTGRVQPPPEAATGLSAIRGLPDGSLRQYSAVEFDHGRVGVARFVHRCAAIGLLKPSSAEPSYAVLDVLDAEGDIIGDYNVPTAQAFAHIKRKLQLTVEATP